MMSESPRRTSVGRRWFDPTRRAEHAPKEGDLSTDVVDHDPGSDRSIAVSGSTGRHDPIIARRVVY